MSDIPAPPQPELLSNFPRYILGRSDPLYRLHWAHRAPVWFSADSTGGRFNPPAGNLLFGTCYVAASPESAMLEVFGRVRAAIDQSDVERRNLSILSVTRDMALADLTATQARGFGITGEVHAGGPASYPACQAWAAALQAAGYAGVRYLARHDPSMGSVSYALFGDPGDDNKVFDPPTTFEIPGALIDTLTFEYGIPITPPARPR
jgi:RES domain-containing protein